MVANDINMSANTSNTESPSRQMTVVDVYDLASVIGKDFERIIDHNGADSVAQLMPKVISALELLEAFATRNERENEEISTLQSTVNRLEAEKIQKKEGRQKFETELEQIEENYRNEIRQLWDMVQKLQEENKRLSNNLENKVDSPTQQALKEEDLKVMMTLQDNVEKQRDTLKIIQKENDVKSQEIEQLQHQTEKYQRTNKELSRKNKILQNQSRILIEEKVDFLSSIQDRDQTISQLQLQLGETEKAKKDLEETKVENKQPIDNEHVPKFTLAELREVLKEKNNLKNKVLELEEELAQLRPAPAPSPNPSEKLEDDDLVVYGPINKEPEEKLFPWKYERKDSGVRKFLMNMFRKSESKKKAQVKRQSEPSVIIGSQQTSFNELLNNDDLRCSSPSSTSSSASFSKIFHPTTPGAALNRSDIIFCRPSSNHRSEHEHCFYANYQNNVILSDSDNQATPKTRNLYKKTSTADPKKSLVVRYVHPEESDTCAQDENDGVSKFDNDISIIDKPIEFSLSDDHHNNSASKLSFLN